MNRAKANFDRLIRGHGANRGLRWLILLWSGVARIALGSIVEPKNIPDFEDTKHAVVGRQSQLQNQGWQLQPGLIRLANSYRAGAIRGDAKAQFQLAMMYDSGRGVPKNLA